MLGATTEAKHPHPRRRACIRCTTAKSKCVLLKDRLACERCTRLDRPCQFDDSAQPRKRQSGTRVEKLEEKVEALVAALQAQKHDSEATPQPTPESTTSPTHSHPASSEREHPTSISPEAHYPAVARQYIAPALPHLKSRNLDSRSYQETSPNDTAFPFPDVFDRQFLTLEDADALIEKYRRVKLIHFPFVVVPPDTDAARLRRECPFLLLAVLTACTEDRIQLQTALFHELKREVSRRVIEGQDKSLEILQGLLVNVCYHHYHLPYSKQMYVYLQIAISLVSDLCLDRMPAAPGSIDYVHYTNTPHAAMAAKRSRNAAEKRAYLGLQYLHCVGTPFRRLTYLKQTPYLMQCCETLEKQAEFPSDANLKIYIQGLLLTRKIEEVSNRDGNINNASDGMLDMVIEVIRNEIAKAEHDALAAGLDSDQSIMLLFKFLYVSVHELSLRKAPDEAPTQMMSRTSQGWALLSAGSVLVDGVSDLGREGLQHMPGLNFATSWYAFILLSRMQLLPSGPHWNQDQARKIADVSRIAKRVNAHLHTVSQGIQNDPASDQEDIWTYFCRAIDAVARVSEQVLLRTARNSPRAMEPQPAHTLPPIQPSPSILNQQLPSPAHIAQVSVGPPAYNQAPYDNMNDLSQAMLQPGDQEMIDVPGIWDDAAWQRIMADMPLDTSGLSMDNNIFGYQLF